MNPALAIDLIVQTLRTSNTLLRESRRLFRPFGLTEVQFNVLNILASSSADLTQREISDILVVDRSNITGLLDRMEAAGWVKREDVPGDRRAYRVRLTPSGRRLWNKVYPEYEHAAKAVAAALGVERVRSTIAGLAALEKHAAGKGGTAGEDFDDANLARKAGKS